MDPRALCARIDSILQLLNKAFAEKIEAEKSLDKHLYDKRARQNHGLGILKVLFEKAQVKVETFQSVKALDAYFADMREATAKLKQTSPVFAYCVEHQIDITQLQPNSIELFCKIISIVGLMIRQKYLLSQFANDDTETYFAGSIEEINAKYQTALERLSQYSNDDIVKKLHELNVTFNKFSQKIRAQGYAFCDWPVHHQGLLPMKNDFAESMGEWLACLPSEATHKASSYVEHTHQKAKAAITADKTEDLFNTRTKASARAYRINSILPYVQKEMQTYLNNIETILSTLEGIHFEATEGEHKKKTERLIRLIGLLQALKVGFKTQSIKSSNYHYTNLKVAMISINQLVRLKKSELKSLSQFRSDLRKFLSPFLIHLEAIEKLLWQKAMFASRKKELEQSKESLSEKFALAKENVASSMKQLATTAERYVGIAKLEPNVRIGQVIKSNWKISLIGCVVVGGALSALGFFYIALPLIPLAVLAAGSSIGGLLSGFVSGVFFDHCTRRKLPDVATIIDKYFPHPLPSKQSKDSYVMLLTAGLKKLVSGTGTTPSDKKDKQEDDDFDFPTLPDGLFAELSDVQPIIPIRSIVMTK